jgi:predicted permease
MSLRGGHPVVVLSYGLWTRRFGGNPAVVGQAVRVNGTLMTVIGVAPRDFFGVVVGAVTDLYVPLMMKAQVTPTWDRLEDRTMHFLHLLARLKPGITAAQAQSALQAIYLPIREADLAAMTGPKSERFLERYSKKQLVVNPAATGVPTFTEAARTPLTLLMVMVGLVLLIACANVANLLVARALGRQKEIAFRLSLGARRMDVVRQLLVESILLALGGAIAGLAVASWTSDFIVAAIPASSAGALNPVLDPRTLWFGLALALITGIGFGLLPAWQATRPQLATALRAQGGGLIGGFRQIRSRQALVVIQVALSLLLLMGAGLFTRSLANLRKLDPGFQTQNLILFALDAARAGYPQPRVQQVYETIQERLSAIPGVRSAVLTDVVPLSGDRSVHAVTVAGYTPKPDENTAPDFAVVSPGYFRSMGIELLAGREFTAQDQAESRSVAVVNQTFARYFFGIRIRSAVRSA